MIPSMGDRGQRYEIRAIGYPVVGSSMVVGWVDTLDSASRVGQMVLKMLGCLVKIYDRRETSAVVVQFPGAMA